MATTSPDNIWTPDSGDDYALTVDLAAMADTMQDALVSRPRTYRTGTDAERLALTGSDLFEGLRFWVTGGQVEWLYSGGSWVVQDTGWVNITTFGDNWSATSGHTPRIRREGKRVHIAGAVTRTATAGALADILTIPEGFRYTGALNLFIDSVVSSSGQAVQLFFSSAAPTKLAIAPTYVTAPLGSGVVLPLVGTWTVD